MTYTTDSTKIEKFLSLNPYLLGQFGKYRLFEHPTRGDEAPVMMLTPNNAALVSTGFWDMGDFDLELCQDLDPNVFYDMRPEISDMES
jgi:hypothetical protein